MDKKHDVFISYRREGGFETANLIASKLKLSGYRVFLDIHSMHAGDFSEQLKNKVKQCKDFIWVLSPTSITMDDGTVIRNETLAFREGVDYFRDEICWAIEYRKNIIPVILNGFIVPDEFPQIIQDAIKDHNPSCDLRKLQAVVASKNQYFDASVSELKRYLYSRPVIKWGILTLLLSFIIIISISIVFCLKSGIGGNCIITLQESQKHVFAFEGADVELIINDKSLGIKHIYSLQDNVTFTDIRNKEFGEKATIKFQALGYIPICDTITLEKNIELMISRDGTYARYWGNISDIETLLPIDSAAVIIGNRQTYTNKEGCFDLTFPIEEQTEFKRMTVYKKGYALFDDSVVYPGETRIHLTK